jgi:hypothetical protein
MSQTASSDGETASALHNFGITFLAQPFKLKPSFLRRSALSAQIEASDPLK